MLACLRGWEQRRACSWISRSTCLHAEGLVGSASGYLPLTVYVPLFHRREAFLVVDLDGAPGSAHNVTGLAHQAAHPRLELHKGMDGRVGRPVER